MHIVVGRIERRDIDEGHCLLLSIRQVILRDPARSTLDFYARSHFIAVESNEVRSAPDKWESVSHHQGIHMSEHVGFKETLCEAARLDLPEEQTYGPLFAGVQGVE
jgi:hypothetical protein